MKPNRAIEKQLREIEQKIEVREALLVGPKDSQPWRPGHPLRLEFLYDLLLGQMDKLLETMPDEFASTIVEELENTLDQDPALLWNCHYDIGLSLKAGLSPLAAFFVDIAAHHAQLADPALAGSRGSNRGPLALPGELCELLSHCSARLYEVGQGVVLTPGNNAPELLYRFDHWQCAACAYRVPGPKDKADYDRAPFRACPLCGDFCGDWFERRDREKVSK